MTDPVKETPAVDEIVARYIALRDKNGGAIALKTDGFAATGIHIGVIRIESVPF